MAGELADITAFLNRSAAIQEKATIREAFAPALDVSFSAAAIGDDCAAIPDGAGGYLLLAAEGLLPGFVADDP